MQGKAFIICLLLLAGAVSLRAQDYPVSPFDGTAVKPDSLTISPKPISLPEYSGFPGLSVPSLLSLEPLPFETKEQRAARLNALTFSNVMGATGRNLYWDRLSVLTKKQKIVYRVLGLFLSNPYALPDGCVPVMNSSFPFSFVLVPGGAPYQSVYSPEYFPQCIKTEYDFASGTYKQVPVDWVEFRQKLSASTSFHGSFDTTPVPKAVLSPGERIMNAM